MTGRHDHRQPFPGHCAHHPAHRGASEPGIATCLRGSLAAFALLVAQGVLAAPPIGVVLEDASRARQVPVEIHEPARAACRLNCRVVLFGTGYRAAAADYAFLLSALAEAGFLAVGIQHDLERDPPMPNTGNVIRDRTPFWDRGIATLEFVRVELIRRYPEHDWTGVVLAGHSQGGDIAARLASTPGFPASALITLDNRRVPLPRAGQLSVLTIRSADQPADPGVVPDPSVQGDARICVVRMRATRHDDMNNAADATSKARMTQVALGFLLRGRCEADA